MLPGHDNTRGIKDQRELLDLFAALPTEQRFVLRRIAQALKAEARQQRSKRIAEEVRSATLREEVRLSALAARS